MALLEGQVRLRDIEIVFKGYRDPLRVDDFILLDVDRGGGVPSRMHVVLEGIHLDPRQDIFSEFESTMAELDYGPVVARLELSYQYDREKRTLHVDRLKLSAKDVGLVTGTSRLTNLDLDSFFSGGHGINAVSMITAMPAVAFAGAELTFKDDSLAQRYFRAGATRSNRSVEEFIESTVSATEAELGDSADPRVEKASTAIAAFVKNPDQIRAVAAPPKPIPLLRLLWIENLADIIELLHIRLELS